MNFSNTFRSSLVKRVVIFLSFLKIIVETGK